MSRRPADEIHVRMNQRLVNWASFFSGDGAPRVVTMNPGPEEQGFTPNIQDAHEIEAALVALKNRRPKLWWCIEECYVRRRDDASAADAQKMSVAYYRSMISRCYEWLDAYIEGRLDKRETVALTGVLSQK